MARFFGCNLEQKRELRRLDGPVLSWLTRLPPEFTVFIEVEAGDFSVDFLVLKPNGIFNVEAKNWNVKSARADGDWELADGEMRKNPFLFQVMETCEKVKDYIRVQREEIFGVNRAEEFMKYIMPRRPHLLEAAV